MTNSLLKRFDLITDTPGNIPLLRRLVIDLAVRGKLGQDETTEESPTVLISRIAAKKEQLIRSGRIKKQKPLPPIGIDDVPSAYAAQCVFERLGNIAILEKGLTGIQSSTPGEYTLVVTAEARASCDHYDFEGSAAIIPMVSSSGHGDASLKRLHYQEGKFALGNILCAVFPISEDLISARFLYEYLTAFKEELLVSKMIGTANVSLTIGKIAEVPVPIVSPAVQLRAYELMRLCDQLEEAQAEREKRRDQLAVASLHRIDHGADGDPDTFREHTRFHLGHFSRLTTNREHIFHLRKTILGLAVRGNLVERSHAKEQVEQDYLHDRASDELPPNWRLLNFGKYCDIQGGNQPPKSQFSAVPRPGYVRLFQIRDLGNKPVPTYIPVETTNRFCREGEILIGRYGASVGKVFWAQTGAYNVALAKFIYPANAFVPQFAFLVLKSDFLQVKLTDATRSAQAGFNKGDLANIDFPLPPLAEQHRIVTKFNELMALCDRLESELTTTQTESRRLLEAVLHGTLTPTNAPTPADTRAN